MCVCYIKFAGYTGGYVVPCSYVESNSVLLVTNDDTTSAVSPTRRGAHEKMYGIRNRRRNVYASLEVWMLWLGCLTKHNNRPRCRRVVNSGIHAPHVFTFGEPSSSLPNHLSSLTSSISSTSDFASSVLALLLRKKLWTSVRPYPWRWSPHSWQR